MSTVSLNVINAQTLINQGFQGSSTNPSGLRLNRRGRLARTLLVLSLAVVLASVFGLKAGAGTPDHVGAPTSFIQVTVAPGDTLWSLATRMADGGDVRSLVDEIASVNSLATAEVQAGQKLRIPLR
ncbi:LysM peptidoglycan-binding domain-containing protein [Actinobacteria bacterium IMCC26103]|nr:LysM peptidoglycan-binding domain-containing protein [Actinobacteria bacterium IMCC26103]